MTHDVYYVIWLSEWHAKRDGFGAGNGLDGAVKGVFDGKVGLL